MRLRDSIFEKVYSRLEKELPSYLAYHNVEHTQYVVEKAIFLAKEENIEDLDLDLVAVAALYHDTGFLIGRDNHENNSCDIARKDIPKYNFTEVEMEKICGMIQATKIPQEPKTLLEKIVADADLFYLGTENYSRFSRRLYEELKHYFPEMGEDEWLKMQLDFLGSHHYHTNYARKYLNPVKLLNLEKLLVK